MNSASTDPTVKSLVPLLVVALCVGGCASIAPSAPPPSVASPSPADQRAALSAGLVTERQWLQSWFRGTPVLIQQRNDGAVSVEIPREFSFDPGHSNVKPPLAAVLDKVAESLRRLPMSRLSLLAAPADASGIAALAVERAAQVQKHLLSRGVPAARIDKPTTTSAAAVQLRLGAARP